MTIPIQPDDIDTTKHFWNAFGNMEREVSARWIVQFCQERGEGWAPFTHDQIERFYRDAGYKSFWFNGLDSGWGISYEDGYYVITPEFVGRCYAASPGEVLWSAR